MENNNGYIVTKRFSKYSCHKSDFGSREKFCN